jgi:hypothetical protein
MFDSGMVTTEDLHLLVAALRRLEQSVDDVARVEQLAALERLKAAAAGAQARVTAAFVESQEAVAEQWRERARECADARDFEAWRAAREQARQATLEPGDAGSGVARRRRSSPTTGVAAQVALARRESPTQGSRHVGLALALIREMPYTLAALESGLLSEWRATIIVRETAGLSAEQRTAVDAEVCGPLGERLGALGDRELVRRVRAVAYRLDAASVMARCTQAQTRRRVTIRPAPTRWPTSRPCCPSRRPSPPTPR